MPIPGQIWLQSAHYIDADGIPHRKYLLVLAVEAGDVTFRLLTSQPNGLSEQPRCQTSPPRDGFYLGVLGGDLAQQSWLDLGLEEDLDEQKFLDREKAKRLRYVFDLNGQLFCDALLCAAYAQDTTKKQARRIMNVRAARGCS